MTSHPTEGGGDMASPADADECAECEANEWGLCDEHFMDGNPPGSLAAAEGVFVPRELFDFLMGAGEIDGTSFGELHGAMPGRFWWRSLLRAAEAHQVAQAIETRRAETGTGSVHESAVGSADAPESPRHDQ